MSSNEKIDATIQELLEIQAGFDAPMPYQLSAQAARNLPTLKNAVDEMLSANFITRALSLVKPSPDPVGNISHLNIVYEEGSVLARVYTPKGKGPFAVVVYFGGGGWVKVNLDDYETTCRAICNTAECIVVSVACRQAPEHPYPAPVNDAYAALQWVMQHAEKINGDASCVAVAGEGTGGNLATVCCIKAKEEGGQMPGAQILMYPVTCFFYDNTEEADFANLLPYNNKLADWWWQQYLQNDEKGNEPYASPLLQPDLTNLPPTFILSAEADVLRPQIEQYAVRLYEAGVDVIYKSYEGMIHNFISLASVVDTAEEAIEDASLFLIKVFKKEETTTEETI